MTAAPPSPAALLEAVLFSSPTPLALPALRAATDLTKDEALRALEELSSRYDPAFSGVVLREVAGGYQLATSPGCAPAVERLREEAPPTQPSNAALEVLSCALYLGPLTRAKVSAVRGVNSDAVVRGLIDRGLLAEVGVDEESPGSPSLLGVTDDLLVAAGAGSREDFPPLDSFLNPDDLARLRERLAVPPSPAEAPDGTASG